MDNENLNVIPQPCAKCAEYQEEEAAYEIAIVALSFIGPIIGILIGLFAAKKLFSRGAE